MAVNWALSGWIEGIVASAGREEDLDDAREKSLLSFSRLAGGAGGGWRLAPGGASARAGTTEPSVPPVAITCTGEPGSSGSRLGALGHHHRGHGGLTLQGAVPSRWMLWLRSPSAQHQWPRTARHLVLLNAPSPGPFLLHLLRYLGSASCDLAPFPHSPSTCLRPCRVEPPPTDLDPRALLDQPVPPCASRAATMQQRRDEILAKKAKLAELKRQRELRASQSAAGRQSTGGPSDVSRPCLAASCKGIC